MTDSDARTTWEALRAEQPAEAVITRDLIDALENLASGQEGGFYSTLGTIVGGVAALEQRMLELERHVHLGE